MPVEYTVQRITRYVLIQTHIDADGSGFKSRPFAEFDCEEHANLVKELMEKPIDAPTVWGTPLAETSIPVAPTS